MKLKDGFILRQVADTYIVVAVGERAKLCNVMVTLNETGAFLWKKISEGMEKEEIKKALLEEYDIDEASADRDVSAFVKKLEDNGLFED